MGGAKNNLGGHLPPPLPPLAPPLMETAFSRVHIVHKEHNPVIFQTFQPAMRWAFGGR